MSEVVAVVGAGPAGCAAAAAAVHQGRTAVLLDPAFERDGALPPRIGEGAAPGTPQLIEEIFGRETNAFAPQRHVKCPGTVSVWGAPEPVLTEHVWNPLGLAWNLDRNRFDDDLRAGVRRLGVECTAAKITSLDRDASGWIVRSHDLGGRVRALRAGAVVDCSGRGARVARHRGASRHHLDRLVALWSVWSVDEVDQRSSTYVEAGEGGWWYSTLLPGRRRMVAHLTDGDLLPTGMAGRRDLALSARRLPLIGGLLEASDTPSIVYGPKLAVARSSWLERPAGPGWLAAGDAACTVDPLSGRGIVSALLTGRAAGQAASALCAGHDEVKDMVAYQSLVAELVLDGCARRVDAYRTEARWPASTFWRRRHQVSPALARRPGDDGATRR